MKSFGNRFLTGSALGSMLTTFNRPPIVQAGQRVVARGRESRLTGKTVERA